MENTINTIQSTQPSLLPIATGDVLKIFEVSGSPGMAMPLHYSTEEAVVTVKEGESKLQFQDNEWILSVGDTFLIPAGKLHSLTILEEFKALVVMPLKSNIKFVSKDGKIPA